MSGMRTILGRRRAWWRRWLLPCVALFTLQAAAPALAWCLHDGAGAHVGSALTHCDHQDPQHQMIDAQPPAASGAHSVGCVSTPCVAIVGRLLLADWLEDGSLDPPARLRIVDTRPPPLIERLSGQTTRLLI
jgi:hypothetical protein